MTTRLPVGRAVIAAGCVWLADGGRATAFFPPLPLTPEPVATLPAPVLPVAPPAEEPFVPTVPAPPILSPRPVPPPIVVPPNDIVVPRPTVPEPTTLLSAAAGLATLAAARRARRATPR